MFKSAILSQLIIWNVGQGQWVTKVTPQACTHFDLGGEKNVSSQVLKLCQNKKNILFLSHWDLDHISFASSYAASINANNLGGIEACLTSLPEGATSNRKWQSITKIPICKEKPTLIRIVAHPLSKAGKQTAANDLSQVIEDQVFKILLPGDSPKKEELKWAHQASAKSIGLVLGHHGSRTSTSHDLLAKLPNLKWAVASARKAKYGHPHKETVERLKLHRIPILKTEDWGNIHFLDYR